MFNLVFSIAQGCGVIGTLSPQKQTFLRSTAFVLDITIIALAIIGALGATSLLSLSPGGSYALIGVGGLNVVLLAFWLFRAVRPRNCCKSNYL